MIPLSWQTALARKSSLAGSFVALAPSVGLLGAMALTIVSAVTGGRTQQRWFTRPPAPSPPAPSPPAPSPASPSRPTLIRLP
jgi:hypothetical protein